MRGFAHGLPDKCARRPRVLMIPIAHEPARQDRHPAFHLSARLPVGLRPRYRGDRQFHHRPGARFQAADLYGRRGLRQGRALCRAYPSSGPADVSAVPGRTQRLRQVRAHFVGRCAGRDRGAFQSGRARVRCRIGLALLLCRHHGPGDARRHQPSHPCEEIFALLRHDLLDHRARRLCRRHRQGRRRRSARDGASPTSS